MIDRRVQTGLPNAMGARERNRCGIGIVRLAKAAVSLTAVPTVSRWRGRSRLLLRNRAEWLAER